MEKRLRQIAKGPAVVIAIICMIVSLIMPLMVIFSEEAGAVTQLNLLQTRRADIDPDVARLVFFLIAFAPTILTAIGMLMVTTSATKEEVKGFGAIKAGVIVSLIFYSIVALYLVVTIVSILTSMAKGYVYSEGEALTLALVLCVALFLSSMYFAKMLSTINALRDGVNGRPVRKKPFIYVAVIHILLAAGSIYSVVGMVNAKRFFDIAGSYGTMSLISTIASAGMNLCIAVIVIQGKKAMDTMEHSACDTEKAETFRFCKHCGKKLYGEEVCHCQDTVVITIPEVEEVKTEPVEEKPRKFCKYCGNALYGDEVCSCQLTVEPEETETIVKEPEKAETIVKEPEKNAEETDSGSRIISTMRVSEKPNGYDASINNEEGKHFFSSAGDLD